MAEEYKEPDRAYVAKQFNGGIITAFIKAVYNFLHKNIDHHADYFKNLSIETADTAHLKLIGNLMGLQLFQLFLDVSGGMYLVFTDADIDTSLYEYDNGWSAVYRAYQAGDGVFGTGEEQGYPVVLTNEQYRQILRAISSINAASIDSILTIDVLVKALLGNSNYNISYNNGYKDVVNVVLGLDIPIRYTTVLQSMFDRLFGGATVTILVTHI